MIRFVVIAGIAATVAGCGTPPMTVMHHPETKQVVTCDGASGGAVMGMYGLQKAHDSCVEQHLALGFQYTQDIGDCPLRGLEKYARRETLDPSRCEGREW